MLIPQGNMTQGKRVHVKKCRTLCLQLPAPPPPPEKYIILVEQSGGEYHHCEWKKVSILPLWAISPCVESGSALCSPRHYYYYYYQIVAMIFQSLSHYGRSIWSCWSIYQLSASESRSGDKRKRFQRLVLQATNLQWEWHLYDVRIRHEWRAK